MKTLHTLNTTNDLSFINSEPYRSMQKTINSVTQPLLESTSKLQDQLRPIREIAKQIKKASSLNQYPTFTKIQNEVQPTMSKLPIMKSNNFYHNSFRDTLNTYGVQNVINEINKNRPYLDNRFGSKNAYNAYNSVNNSIRNYMLNSSATYNFEKATNASNLDEKLNVTENLTSSESKTYLDKLREKIGYPNKIISTQQFNNARRILKQLLKDKLNDITTKNAVTIIWNYVIDSSCDLSVYIIESYPNISSAAIASILIINIIKYLLIF